MRLRRRWEKFKRWVQKALSEAEFLIDDVHGWDDPFVRFKHKFYIRSLDPIGSESSVSAEYDLFSCTVSEYHGRLDHMRAEVSEMEMEREQIEAKLERSQQMVREYQNKIALLSETLHQIKTEIRAERVATVSLRYPRLSIPPSFCCHCPCHLTKYLRKTNENILAQIANTSQKLRNCQYNIISHQQKLRRLHQVIEERLVKFEEIRQSIADLREESARLLQQRRCELNKLEDAQHHRKRFKLAIESALDTYTHYHEELLLEAEYLWEYRSYLKRVAIHWRASNLERCDAERLYNVEKLLRRLEETPSLQSGLHRPISARKPLRLF